MLIQKYLPDIDIEYGLQKLIFPLSFETIFFLYIWENDAICIIYYVLSHVPSQEYGNSYIINRFSVCYILMLCRCSPLIVDAFPSVLVCSPDLFFFSIDLWVHYFCLYLTCLKIKTLLMFFLCVYNISVNDESCVDETRLAYLIISMVLLITIKTTGSMPLLVDVSLPKVLPAQ